jgi:hypothetical protein
MNMQEVHWVNNSQVVQGSQRKRLEWKDGCVNKSDVFAGRNGMGDGQSRPGRHQVLGDDGMSSARSGHEACAEDGYHQTLASVVQEILEDQ